MACGCTVWTNAGVLDDRGCNSFSAARRMWFMKLKKLLGELDNVHAHNDVRRGDFHVMWQILPVLSLFTGCFAASTCLSCRAYPHCSGVNVMDVKQTNIQFWWYDLGPSGPPILHSCALPGICLGKINNLRTVQNNTSQFPDISNILNHLPNGIPNIL